MAMDHLRQGVGLQSYAAKDPKQEYKKEAFAMFSEMLENMKVDAIGILSKVQIRAEQDMEPVERHPQVQNMQYNHPSAPDAFAGDGEPAGPEAAAPQAEPQIPYVRKERKVGRNESCPCGSGKKYKNCHGRLA